MSKWVLSTLHKCLLSTYKLYVFLCTLFNQFLILLSEYGMYRFMEKYNLFVLANKTKRINVKIKMNCEITNNNDIPKHIGIIINEQMMIDELVNSILCIIDTFSKIGVEILTFYKYDGISEEVKTIVLKKIIERSTNGSDKDKVTDMLLNSSKQKLNFISYNDGGKCLLAKTIQSLTKRDLNDFNVDQATLDEAFNDVWLNDEPQLLILIGDCKLTAGFSPWHIRLSEIITIPSHKLLCKENLSNVIKKYAKIEKRFGK